MATAWSKYCRAQLHDYSSTRLTRQVNFDGQQMLNESLLQRLAAGVVCDQLVINVHGSQAECCSYAHTPSQQIECTSDSQETVLPLFDMQPTPDLTHPARQGRLLDLWQCHYRSTEIQVAVLGNDQLNYAIVSEQTCAANAFP